MTTANDTTAKDRQPEDGVNRAEAIAYLLEVDAETAAAMAAGPDLLAACSAIVFQVCQGKVLERDACITQARKAIAKAEGK